MATHIRTLELSRLLGLSLSNDAKSFQLSECAEKGLPNWCEVAAGLVQPQVGQQIRHQRA